MEITRKVGIGWKERRLIGNLYCEQAVVVQTPVGNSSPRTISKEGKTRLPIIFNPVQHVCRTADDWGSRRHSPSGEEVSKWSGSPFWLKTQRGRLWHQLVSTRSILITISCWLRTAPLCRKSCSRENALGEVTFQFSPLPVCVCYKTPPFPLPLPKKRSTQNMWSPLEERERQECPSKESWVQNHRFSSAKTNTARKKNKL